MALRMVGVDDADPKLPDAVIVASVGTAAGDLAAGNHTHTGLLDQTTADDRYVNSAGDTLTGALTLNADPTLPLHAATKAYVDAAIAAALVGYVPPSGSSTVPSEPTGVQGVASTDTVSLVWNAPATNGGDSIVAYRVQYSANAGSTWTTFSTVTDEVEDITGLTPNTTYLFRVAAINSAGSGPYSSPYSITTQPYAGASTVPGAPTGLAGTPTTNSVALTWSAPASDGGSGITGYRVQYSANGGATWTDFGSPTPGTSRTVTGLTGGIGYRFRVAAVNAIGTGAPSASITVSTLAALPSEPLNLVASVSGNNVALDWDAPLQGDGITDYVIEYAPLVIFSDNFNRADGPIGSNYIGRAAFGGNVCDISNNKVVGPTTGTRVNDWVGTIPADFYAQVTVNIAADTDASIGLLGRGNAASERNEVGAEIAADMYYEIAEFITNQHNTRARTTNGSVPVGQDLHIRLEAVGNQVRYFVNGEQILSAVMTTITAGAGRIGFGANNAGSTTFDNFEVGRWDPSTWSVYSDATSTATSATVSGLPVGEYFFRVRAVNSAGQSLPSAMSQRIRVAPVAAAPSAPTGLVAFPSDTKVVLMWTHVSEEITDYVVQYSSNGGSSWSTFAEGPSTQPNTTVTGLTNGTSYVFRVAGVTSGGQGSYSSASATVSPSAAHWATLIDNFDRADNASLGSNWGAASGVSARHQIHSNDAWTNTSQVTTIDRWIGATSIPNNVIVTADMLQGSNTWVYAGYLEIIARMQADFSGYSVLLIGTGSWHPGSEPDKFGVKLIRRTGGTEVTLGTSMVPNWTGSGHRFGIGVSGSKLVALVDGNPILYATDTTYATGTIGINTFHSEGGQREYQAIGITALP